jgi:hypothetical protein
MPLMGVLLVSAVSQKGVPERDRTGRATTAKYRRDRARQPRAEAWGFVDDQVGMDRFLSA